jgi:2-polyprenyl-3-methyl-5-hydroxy-6-metoxy-1,4-benzoquinol methylase
MNYTYEGQELELFREARNWKRYFSRRLQPFISGDVLEVGAGIGETTPYLENEKVRSWTCLEPDEQFCRVLEQRIKSGQLKKHTVVKQGTMQALAAGETFDTILYIDVLEHIEHDDAELKNAAAHLRPGGRLIVLSPALPSVYNAFDKAIGHYRRYTKKMLHEAACETGLRPESMYYLESTGVFLLWVNKLLAREKYPTKAQVRFWDRLLVPISQLVDKLVFFSFGKTIIGIWRKS